MIWLLHLPLIICPSLPFFTLLQPSHILQCLLNTLSLFLSQGHCICFLPRSSHCFLFTLKSLFGYHLIKEYFPDPLTRIAPPLPAPLVLPNLCSSYHSRCLKLMIYLFLTILSIPWRQGCGILQHSIPSARNGPLHIYSPQWMSLINF